jgi:hypothetical protein
MHDAMNPDYPLADLKLVGCAVRTMKHGSVRTAHPTEHLAPGRSIILCLMDNLG